ncbi:SDR family NAD(P)-dependent oxidoreductase [Bacillus gobiensis]|uniref:SDR family oxidoreductase n=1 Tax=Bacillus gobiensis TaxID=1441095 RepID=UPI003D23EFD3
MENLMLNGKVAIVTGAGSGIGEATAVRLAKAGAKVGLIEINEENAKRVEDKIANANGEAVTAKADVSNPAELKSAIDSIYSKWGQIDTVFANAGINGRIAPIEELEPEDWDKTLTTNLKSTFLTVKYSLPYMKENGGSIIITSSINGNRVFSNFGFSAYSTSKAGQTAFGQMAALELARYKIRVNIVCPGAISTNIDNRTYPDQDSLEKIKIPVEFPEGDKPLRGKSGEPEQVADLVHFLASDASNHITGTRMYIDGAESLIRG